MRQLTTLTVRLEHQSSASVANWGFAVVVCEKDELYMAVPVQIPCIHNCSVLVSSISDTEYWQ
jgi:hypothetical protein